MSSETPSDALADDDREPSLRDVLEAMEAIDGPGVTASEVSIVLGCSADTARRRLNELFEQGMVKNQRKGQQLLWWRPGRERVEKRETVNRYEPVDGPETNAIELIESGETDE